MRLFQLLVLALFGISALSQVPKNMVIVKSGKYLPLYSLDSGVVKVNSFYIDKYLVTNSEYEHFVARYPEWKKGVTKPIFADVNYLKHWQYSNKLGKDSVYLKNSPVVNVSWFAAKKYCECQGKRLPTVDEWEYVALASANKYNASKDSGFYQMVLDWYSKPSPKYLASVGKGFKNVYGIYDMHGLVWEWNLDFLSALSTKDSRDGNNLDKNEFCGAGSKGSKSPSNYAAFMRYAMRASLKANYTVGNVGFRCVKDVNTVQ